jgi:hypothetical protein
VAATLLYSLGHDMYSDSLSQSPKLTYESNFSNISKISPFREIIYHGHHETNNRLMKTDDICRFILL